MESPDYVCIILSNSTRTQGFCVFACILCQPRGNSTNLSLPTDKFFIEPERIMKSRLIGEGAQGKVYLGTMKQNNGTEKIVAVKNVKEIEDKAIRLLRKINHENIGK